MSYDAEKSKYVLFITNVKINSRTQLQCNGGTGYSYYFPKTLAISQDYIIIITASLYFLASLADSDYACDMMGPMKTSITSDLMPWILHNLYIIQHFIIGNNP